MESSKDEDATSHPTASKQTVAVVPYCTATSTSALAQSGGEDENSLGAFLQINGLEGLAASLQGTGFHSIQDVLALTPRRYGLAGVPEQVGTRIRLQRAIESQPFHVQVADGTLAEFMLPSSSTFADLHDSVSSYTGLTKESFWLVSQRMAREGGTAVHRTFARVSKVVGENLTSRN